MSKKIVIESCQTCQYRDHEGAFGRVSYVPFCKLSQKRLPHEVVADGRHLSASLKPGIPVWCQLEDN